MNLTGKPSIRVLQYMYGDLTYFPVSERINRPYCDQFGYEYVLSREIPRQDRHVNWHKVPVIRKELKNCDYLLFLDADAFFYGRELTIENELLPLLEGKKMIIAQDCVTEDNRWNAGRPNTGVLLMENIEPIHELLEYWDETSEEYIQYRWKIFHEQSTFELCVLKQYPELVRLVGDYYRMNSLKGLYIRHFMGWPNECRAEQMEEYYRTRILTL